MSTVDKAQFSNLKYKADACTNIIEQCKVKGPKSWGVDHTSFFIGHACLYGLADKYHIEALKDLTLQKLHATLESFSPSPNRINDILQLAEFAYDNTSTRLQMDALRELIVKYIASRGRTIASTEPYLVLVQENGSFASDLLTVMMQDKRCTHCRTYNYW